MNAGRSSAQQGMSLIEQIMVLAIVGVLTGMAVPSMRQLLGRNQLQVAQTDFMAALRHARERAITSNRRTVFCPSRDHGTCSDESRWDYGWLLGPDRDHDDQPDSAPSYSGAGYDGHVIIRSSPGRRIVRFRPDGSARGSNLTLLFCATASTEQALTVVVSNAGRIRGAPANAKQAATCAQGR